MYIEMPMLPTHFLMNVYLLKELGYVVLHAGIVSQRSILAQLREPAQCVGKDGLDLVKFGADVDCVVSRVLGPVSDDGDDLHVHGDIEDAVDRGLV
jgi:hypothetical protein